MVRKPLHGSQGRHYPEDLPHVGRDKKRPFSRSFKVTTALLRRRLWQVKGMGRLLGLCPAEPVKDMGRP